MTFLPVETQMETLREGLEEIYTEEALCDKLEASRREGRPLRVKQGFDPTAPDIHLGHTVGLCVLRRFQDLGHQVVVIVGDFTALVGDPSGRNKTRPRLTREEILSNAETYREQFSRVLDPERTEVRFNGDWFAEMDFAGILELSSRFTVARMMERDDFHKRYTEGRPISVHEFLYPLMQGYDSVEIRADVEIGATEQTFNLLAARHIQKEYGMEPQVALTFPVLTGLDGVQRMSKSLGNYVGVTDAPEDMYGKVMSIPDELMPEWYRMVSGLGAEAMREALEGLEAGGNPLERKDALAAAIVGRFHTPEAVTEARAHFDRVVRRKESPDEVPVAEVPANAEGVPIANLLKETGLAPSTSEARRLVKGGGVQVDDSKWTDPQSRIPAEPGTEIRLKVGKRRFLRVRFGGGSV
ncbi:MAG: tyrosine--tRNA ligase [Gemmatimonadota bacterium]|jgi:tyrosyl-tRNA synthetase|nr:tyrosine--tRNA ligase [Gemmatimonadota bacterium]MDP6803462.1 tyrosine--tRNA ligase [Gemmatimonadota bacterium]MDP7032584.1 tyrosine--tRNA ligase [Gemmatimonadota bacterium]